MNEPSLLYQIALTRINGVGNITARHLLSLVDDVSELFTTPKTKLSLLPGLSPLLLEKITDKKILTEAAKETDFVLKHSITTFFITDEAYPYRLRECPDAPVLLYYKGNANLNSSKIISIVGTREMTQYGKEAAEKIIKGLQNGPKDLLIISGLAYGVDICAHRTALHNGISTIGVLAHGLDRIYPSIHRNTAKQMIGEGGLITEFPSGTKPDRQNFVKRNRIIAGLSDATIVIESAEKGGSIITAEIANSYYREVFAVPGRRDDHYSQGCNQLIRQNKAGLIGSASDLFEAMGWNTRIEEKNEPKEAQLPLAMNEEEELIIQTLQKEKEIQINHLLIQTNLPIHRLSPILFDLELRGIIRCLPGGIYKLT
ncbi:MAG: DNA-processing protein DprA [Bacteroidales bacterium]|nr:DNA-processing protein DprA [Bacteroidales bacterium]